MIKASMNQLANVTNPYQGKAKKVLCVCSAGLLRSPTIAEVLTRKFGYNTRAVGTAEEYALIPISEALLNWADEIFVTSDQAEVVEDMVEELGLYKTVIVLGIPDKYVRNNYMLIRLIEKQLDDMIKVYGYEVG